MIGKMIRDNKLLTMVVAAYLGLFIIQRQMFYIAAITFLRYLWEMVQIMPPIFVLTSLLMLWIPSRVIVNNFGVDSGWKGKVLSVCIGSVSAGPIYAAFPVASALMQKGGSLTNGVILICSWAVIKIPMLMVETKFLGARFSLTRTALTIPSVILIGWLVGKMMAGRQLTINKADV